MDSQIQKRSKKNLRITSCNKVCSVHFEQDNNVKFVNNQIRRLKDGACQSSLLCSTRSNLKEKQHFIARMIIPVIVMFWHQPSTAVSFHDSSLPSNRLILLS